MLKISIVTITFNSQATVEDTIRSVVTQDYPDLEYLIIDGLSKDNTLKIVDKYRDRIARVVSEKDKGLYDALNKGIRHATGDVVGLLHSDDLYTDPHVLSKVAACFEKDPALQAVYADLVFVSRDDTGKVLRTWKSGPYQEGSFLQGWMPPHPTFFVRKSVYEQYGDFNTKLRLSADYELMLRFIHKHKIKIGYLPETIVRMRMGGVSNTSFFVKLKANIEDKLAWRMNGLKAGPLTRFMKPLSKVGQYLKKK